MGCGVATHSGNAGERALAVTLSRDGEAPFASFYCANSCEESQPLLIGDMTLRLVYRIDVRDSDSVDIRPLDWEYGQFRIAGEQGARFRIGREVATVWMLSEGLAKDLVARKPPGVMAGHIIVTVFPVSMNPDGR